jgi:hypothetical protein
MKGEYVWRHNAKMTCKHCGKPITRKPPQKYKIDHTEEPMAYVHLYCWYWYNAEREDSSFIAEWFQRLESLPSDEAIRAVLKRTFKGWADHYTESTSSQKNLMLGDLDHITKALVMGEFTMLWDSGNLQTQVYRHDHEKTKGAMWSDALDSIGRLSPNEFLTCLDAAIIGTNEELKKATRACTDALADGYMGDTGLSVDLQVIILKTTISIKETTEAVISMYPRWD